MKKKIKKVLIPLWISSMILCTNIQLVYADQVTDKINSVKKTILTWLMEAFKAIAPMAIILLAIGVAYTNDETSSRRLKIGLVVILFCYIIARVAQPIITSLN